MKFNRKLVLVLALVLSVAMATTGTLAYLTDRDSAANVFTMGNVKIKLSEDFEQGVTILPGQKVTKAPTIKNTGSEYTYVWMTVAVDEKLSDYLDIKLADSESSNWENIDVPENDRDGYAVTTFLYKDMLATGETTDSPFNTVTLSQWIDITPNGDMYYVYNGETTDLKWNINTNGNPVVYVSAYAIQATGFEAIDDASAARNAYNAYYEQWGNKGTEWATTVTVNSTKELAKAIESITDGKQTNIVLGSGTYEANFKIGEGQNVALIGNGADTVIEGQIATTSSSSGSLSLSNLTINVNGKINDKTGISQTAKSAIAVWGNQTVTCENVTFNMSLSDSTAITSWWDTKEGTSIIVKNCIFNCNGQRPIRATGNVTVEDTTFNDPYRYAVQLTAKQDTATLMDKAVVNFYSNTIINGEHGKDFVYGIQLEGETYGNHDVIINGDGNTIENGGSGSTMYYCECDKVDHDTITWNVETAAVHAK